MIFYFSGFQCSLIEIITSPNARQKCLNPHDNSVTLSIYSVIFSLCAVKKWKGTELQSVHGQTGLIRFWWFKTRCIILSSFNRKSLF